MKKQNAGLCLYLILVISLISPAQNTTITLSQIGVSISCPDSIFLITKDNYSDYQVKFGLDDKCKKTSSYVTIREYSEYKQTLVNAKNLIESITFYNFSSNYVDEIDSIDTHLNEYINTNCWYINDKKLNVKEIPNNKLSSITINGKQKNYFIEYNGINYYSSFYLLKLRNQLIFVVINSERLNEYQKIIESILPIFSEEYFKLKEKIRSQFINKKSVEALMLSQELISKFPNDKNARFLKLSMLIKLKQYSTLKTEIALFKEKFAEDCNNNFLEGLNSYCMKNYSKAIELLQNEIKQRKISFEKNDQCEYYFGIDNLYGFLGDCYFESGLNDNAKYNYFNAIKISTDSAVISISYYNLGLLDERENKYDEAILNYNKAILNYPLEQNDKKAQAYYNRGIMNRKLNNINNAIDDYTSAIQLKPNYVLAYNNRAYAHNLLKNLIESYNDYYCANQYSTNVNEKLLILPGLIENSFLLEKNDITIKYSTELINLKPENKEKLGLAYYYRGFSLMKKGDIKGCSDINKSLQYDYAIPEEIEKMCK